MLIKEIINKFDKSSIKAGDGRSFGNYPLYTCSPVVNKYLDDYICDEEAIILSTGGNFAIHYINGKFNYSTDCYVFNTSKFILKYLYYYLKSKKDEINKMFRGAGLKHLNKNEFLSIDVKEISNSKQIEIVKTLDLIENLIAIKKEEIAHYDKLIKSQFSEMFENIDFPYVPFKEYMERCVDIGSNGANAVVMEHYNMTDTKDYAMVIRFTNLNNGDFENDVKYINKEDYEFFSKSKVYGGEIIFCKIGSAGENYIMPKLDIPVTLGLNQIMITPQNINTRYLYEYINSYDGKKYINNNINGAVTKTITKHALWQFPIKTPPIELQNKFAEFVKQVDKQKFKVQESLKKLEDMQSALMQEYFE